MGTLQAEFKRLVVRRKEVIAKLRNKYKITLHGDNTDTVPELATSFKRMAKELKFSDNFMMGIKKGGYEKPTPV